MWNSKSRNLVKLSNNNNHKKKKINKTLTPENETK